MPDQDTLPSANGWNREDRLREEEQKRDIEKLNNGRPPQSPPPLPPPPLRTRPYPQDWWTAEDWALFYTEQEAGKRLVAELEANNDDKLRAATRPVLLSEVEKRAAKWRIAGLMEIGWVTLLWAAAKTGKSTMIVNLTHSLLSGEPFLGRYEVSPIREGRRVGILNYEMSASGFKEWADKRGVDCSRVAVWNLRGMPNPLASRQSLEWLGAEIRDAGVEYLIIDTYSRAMTADSEDNNPSATSWFRVLGELLAASGATDALVTHHAGHNGARLRGASALRDNPDSLWGLTRGEDGKPDEEVRYLQVEGRFVGEDDGLKRTPLGWRQSDLSLWMSGTAVDAATARSAALQLAQENKDRSDQVIVDHLVAILQTAGGKAISQAALFAELEKHAPKAVPTTNRTAQKRWVDRLRAVSEICINDPLVSGQKREFNYIIPGQSI